MNSEEILRLVLNGLLITNGVEPGLEMSVLVRKFRERAFIESSKVFTTDVKEACERILTKIRYLENKINNHISYLRTMSDNSVFLKYSVSGIMFSGLKGNSIRLNPEYAGYLNLDDIKKKINSIVEKETPKKTDMNFLKTAYVVIDSANRVMNDDGVRVLLDRIRTKAEIVRVKGEGYNSSRNSVVG